MTVRAGTAADEMDRAWKFIEEEYEILDIIGSGSYGQVVRARQRETGHILAIKLIKDVFYNTYEAKKVLREILIMRKLSQEGANIFTA